ncbi:Muskelin N-terminus-domain-containing protein [Gymnopilus junonius]|uniref:Muskelin N-terminus-domain-containing protein n=1 Tax=Gymnopilus junonius TaxID=109634 RepID=A0A9P5NY21_GYMJU|nr:Muskelin N-terminus-domain-containing protein [Gymnopilus junonius]
MPPTTQRASMPSVVPLTYTIASSTPHSGNYGPDNIMKDRPLEPSSRWSGAFQGNAHQQWIILRLESLAVLKTITFGKLSIAHPCNMKELKVFVGMSEDRMTEVLHAGLKNDSTPETFTLKNINDSGVPFPTQFVKIVPILAHGQNFHISIWHVSMAGINDPTYVEQIRLGYEEFRETAVLRYVLKHLRQRRLLTPYQTILSRANIHLEHPLLTQLHESLVLQGNFSRSESLLTSISTSSLFSSYLQSSQPTPLGPGSSTPKTQMMIYLFGGWTGEKSLDDFWRYSAREGRWKLLSANTTQERNAPGAEELLGVFYVLGRLNDSDGGHRHGATAENAGDAAENQSDQQQTDADPAEPPKMYSSEFYRYHTRGMLSGKWDFLSIDTAASGGPPLIFDHQMVMDSEAQILYVFGGRVVDGDWDTPKYSGLYSYNVSTSKWKQLQYASSLFLSLRFVTKFSFLLVIGRPLADVSYNSPQGIPSRSGSSLPPILTKVQTSHVQLGHSMVFDPPSKTLCIFAGQRDEKYLSDMWAYNVETGIATEVHSNFTSAGGPDACFTQRAVIDPARKEIYVFCGLTRAPAPSRMRNASSTINTSSGTFTSSGTLRAHLSDWVYRYDSPSRPGKWMKILRQQAQTEDVPDKGKPSTYANVEIPVPRFAHQVVYNPNTKRIYMHGGNAGWGYGLQGGGAGAGEDDGNVGEGRDVGSAVIGGPAKEKRLDDFWSMELKRPGPEEVIRQAKFQIRQQQFREMCEDGPPVKALTFLQTQVSSVVDHSNVQETETFRALLTHLLVPPPPAPTSGSRPSSSRTSSSSYSSSSLGLGSAGSPIKREDTREGSTRPRKRSRGETESIGSFERESGSDRGSGEWTNELLSDNIVADDATVYLSGGVQRLREMRDPLEDVIVKGGAGASSTSGDDVQQEPGRDNDKLTGARYAQRTEVFEGILKFVVDNEKQPEESLLDLVEGDRCQSEGI